MEEDFIRNSQPVNHPRRINPLIQTNITDAWFILLWIFILLTWGLAVIYAIMSPITTVEESFFEKSWKYSGPRNTSKLYKIVIRPILDREGYIFYYIYGSLKEMITGLGLGLLFVMCSLLFGYYQPHSCCHTGVAFLPILLVLCLYRMYEKLNYSLNYKERNVTFEMMDQYVPEFFTILHVVAALYCLAVVGLSHIYDVIRETTRLYFRFPPLIYFGLLLYTLAAIIAKISLRAMEAMDFQGLLCYFILLEAFYVVFSVHYYGVAVASKVAASWQWKDNRSKSPLMLVWESIHNVARYQFGSIAFGATGIGPAISSVVALIYPKKDSTITRSISDRAFDVILSIYLILHVTKFSLMINSMDGSNFLESTKEAFRLLKKNSCKSFSFISVLYALMIGVLSMMVTLFLINQFTWDKLSPNPRLYMTREKFWEDYVKYMTPYTAMTLPLFVIVDSTGQAYYLFRVKDEEVRNDPDERMCAIPLRTFNYSCDDADE